MGLTQSMNFQTWISPNSKSSLLDLVITNIPTNVSCSSSAPIGSSDHVLMKVNISGYSKRTASTPVSDISLKHIGRDCKQTLLFKTGLPYPLLLMLTQPGNSSKETCSLTCTDSSHLCFNYPTLLPAHGTLNPVMRQLL